MDHEKVSVHDMIRSHAMGSCKHAEMLYLYSRLLGETEMRRALFRGQRLPLSTLPTLLHQTISNMLLPKIRNAASYVRLFSWNSLSITRLRAFLPQPGGTEYRTMKWVPTHSLSRHTNIARHQFKE